MELIRQKQAGLQGNHGYNELKSRVHERLIDILDLSVIDSLDREQSRREIKKVIQGILVKTASRSPSTRRRGNSF